MQIERMTLQNFKGQTADVKLGRLNVFLGPNGSGKSARLVALRYAITGQTPAGAKPGDAMKLARGGRPLSVGVRLDDGFTWTRDAEQDAQGKVTGTVDCTGELSDGVRANEAAVWAHCGNFAPTFDVAAFLGLSPDKRRDLVLTLCSRAASAGQPWAATDMTNTMSIGYCREALGDATTQAHIDGLFASKPVPDQKEDAQAEVLEFLRTKLGDAENRSLDWLHHKVGEAVGLIINDDELGKIAEALQTARTIGNEAKTAANEAIGAARRLNERKAEINILAASIPELEATRKNLVERRETLLQSIGEAQGRARAKQGYEEQINAAIVDAERAGPELEELRKYDAEGARERIAAITEERQALDVKASEWLAARPTREALHTADLKALRAAQDECTAAEEASTEASQAAIECSTAIRAHRTALAAWNATPMARVQKVMDEFRSCIGRNEISSEAYESWCELVALVNDFLHPKAREKIEAAMEAAEKALPDLTAPVDGLYAAMLGARHRLSEAQSRQLDRRVVVEEGQREHGNGQAQALELRSQLAMKTTLLDANKREIAAAEGIAVEARKRRDAAETGLTNLLADEEGAGGGDPEEWKRLALALADEIVGTGEQIEAKNTYQALERELAVCIERTERQKALRDAAVHYADAVRVIREARIQRATEPMLGLMHKFLMAAKPGHEPTLSLANKAFDLGWREPGGHTVPIEALSGGETAIYCAALLYALVALADPPLKLLLIEVGEVDAEHLMRMLDGFEATPDEFQVLIATHSPAGLVADSWNVEHLTAPTHAERLAATEALA